jgi:hypothetical protein
MDILLFLNSLIDVFKRHTEGFSFHIQGFLLYQPIIYFIRISYLPIISKDYISFRDFIFPPLI